MTKLLRWVGCALLAALTATAVPATTLQRLSDDELIDGASLIVTGHCRSMESRWVGRTLVTLVTLEVDDTWKGEKRGEVTVVVPGGIDLDRPVPVTVTYPGAPVFRPDESALVFLQPLDQLDVAGAYQVVGFDQGKLTITDGGDGEKAIRRAGGTVRLRQLEVLVRGSAQGNDPETRP
jgi:hypothetical protein